MINSQEIRRTSARQEEGSLSHDQLVKITYWHTYNLKVTIPFLVMLVALKYSFN